MSSKRQVVSYLPDGTEVTWMTGSLKWDVAGLVKKDGTWTPAVAGTSWDSVLKRARTWMHRVYGEDAETAAIWEVTAPVVAEYFGSHRVAIDSYFTPADGWTTRRQNVAAGRSVIRRLARQGVTAISFKGSGRPAPADFQMAELLASMRTPKAAQ